MTDTETKIDDAHELQVMYRKGIPWIANPRFEWYGSNDNNGYQ